MKNIFKYIGILALIATVSISCEGDHDNFKTFDGTALVIESASLQVPVASDVTVTVPVTITALSNVDRTINLEVASADDSSEFSFGSVFIPANSDSGSFDVSFDISEIDVDPGVNRIAQLAVQPGQGIDVVGLVADIVYFKAEPCNDLTLEIVTDFWASETGFSIVDDATGATVFSFPAGTYANGEQTISISINLPDGCYTATITDAFADGLVSGGVTGSYSLTCDVVDHFSGGGAFGASATGSFCVNQ